MERSLLSKRFLAFSEECKGKCRLYELLSIQISNDRELLQLSSYAPMNQPIPNLLFAAVHYLLLKGKVHELKDFYKSIVAFPKNADHCFPYFKRFCTQYRHEIISLLRQKLVQTNEVSRCVYLYPIFCNIYEKMNKPLALIELGTSAGLQLLWDQYRYSYGTETVYGNQSSNVHLRADIKGKKRPPFLLMNSPPIFSRIGIDLHVNDLNVQEDYLWLQALIWPSETKRRQLFIRAAKIVRQDPPHLVEGDGIDLLDSIVEEVDERAIPCVFHTHVANQSTPQMQQKLLADIDQIGKKKDIFHLYNNLPDHKLRLDAYIEGEKSAKIVGETEAHGKWFTWYL